ncbi:DGQHR domain-containing protein [Paenibacillus peoriae]|uniref:DGQHR domain-containing protein n=1 Tax=Paenibacillus peoriae TaxID=59893 RepID=UPI00026C5A13|nr:DGQHR domain-containing protein [Paenibacillus peoriae]MEC0181346.1 DGQHR domain-containing protein [Paenibacillus peoriae]
MLSNIEKITNLRTLARYKMRSYEIKTVKKSLVESYLSDGWEISNNNVKSVKLKRQKKHDISFSDRVWTLLYKMGFVYLSGEGGSNLINKKNDESEETNLDIVGIDDDISIAVKCISSEKRSFRFTLQDEVSTLKNIRGHFANVVRNDFINSHKRQVATIVFTSNNLSEADRAYANDAKIVVFDEQDLIYYENLTSHLGAAAKYQFCADMFPGKSIPGLSIRVPAVKTKMGGSNCYTFSIPPEYLLKIAYISHRSKGKASDINAYQRMISKSRLSKIKSYINDNGIFPTNIVVNLDQKLAKIRFEKIRQEVDTDSGLLGWLDIEPAYKSAWIIDGQHRLFAYSGLEKASSARLSVLAFEGLPASAQAQLFVDINAKQKSVKQSLLQELYAELHWDSSDPQIRVRAIISKVVQELGENPDSPLYNRVQSADSSKDSLRCITLGSIYSALDKTGFHILRTKNGSPVEYGPLWAGNNEATLKRTIYILTKWLSSIRDRSQEWWDKGSAEGGGLAMNDGITTCLNVLKSVFHHLESSGHKLLRLDNDILYGHLQNYAESLGDYLGSLNDVERKRFRDLRGVQGQTTRTKRCQHAIHLRIPEFNPSGLDEFIKLEKAQTNQKAKQIVDWIETKMQEVILTELKQHYGFNESEWWLQGVPKQVRTKASERFELDDGKRGGKENYFDLMDYKKIILDNWELFEPVFAYNKTGNKDKRTSWLSFVNEKRNIVSHVSAAITLSIQELSQLEEYQHWLSSKLGIDSYENFNSEEEIKV